MAEIMDYGYFFEHDVAIERIKWTGSQGIGLCPLPSHDDRRPSFSLMLKRVCGLALDVVKRVTLTNL